MGIEEFQNAIVREVEQWTGVQIEFRQGVPHPRARLKFGVSVQTVSFPGMPGQADALAGAIAKVAQALKAMGAARAASPAKSSPAARPDITYADGGAVPAQAKKGIDVSEPVAGWYRFRLHGKAVRGGVRIWYGAPLDPITGEEMDRSHRWQAEHDGEPIDFERVWPVCAGEPITEAEYRQLCERRAWARENAPESAYAEPGKRHDPLSLKSPLPF